MLLLTCLLLGLNLATAEYDNFTTFDVPSAVKVGENVTLQCRPREEISKFTSQIYHIPLGEGKTKLLYQRINDVAVNIHGISDRVAVKEDYTIEIFNIQLDYSGKYVCVVEDDDFREHRSGQLLIVYTPGSGPVLQNTTEVVSNSSDEVVVTCAVQGAAPEPELEISVPGKQSLSNVVKKEEIDGAWSIESELTAPDLEDGDKIYCDLFFRNTTLGNFAHEAYRDSLIYKSGGEFISSTAQVETEVVPTPDAAAQPDGSPALHCSWMLLAAFALLLQHWPTIIGTLN